MADDKKAFDDKIEQLANAMADKALGNLPPDRELADCFKALASYYSSSRKLDKTGGDGGEDAGFSGIRKRIAAAGNGTVTSGENEVEH